MTKKLALSSFALVCAFGVQDSSAPPEHGRVRWGRDLEAARDLGKPCFVLFQEVPG